MPRLSLADIFAGFGGFSLAGHIVGWDVKLHVEIDKKCRDVLHHHFPKADSYADIRKFDGKPYEGSIDVLAGGFPCQPFSIAGKRKGKEDKRNLWEEMCRVISEIRPTWVVAENTLGILSMEQPARYSILADSETAYQERCVYLAEIREDLRKIGYGCDIFSIPASACNAPHDRQRVWIVAHTNEGRKSNQPKHEKQGFDNAIGECFSSYGYEKDAEQEKSSGEECSGRKRTVLTKNQGQRQQTNEHRGCGSLRSNQERIKLTDWRQFPTVSRILRGTDGLSNRMVRPKQALTYLQRRQRLGNAISPQVAVEIFEAINQVELYEHIARKCTH